MGWMTVSLQKVEQDTLFEIILAANYLDIKVAYIIQEPEHHSPSISKSLREGVQKNPFLLDFVPNYGQVGVQSPNLFSENNHSVILTANPLFLGRLEQSPKKTLFFLHLPLFTLLSSVSLAEAVDVLS